MADIVERLRLLAAIDNCQASLEAAAEIERLRARLEIDLSHPYDGIYCRDETIRSLEKQIERQKVKIERLRAALEVFACDCEGKAICLGNCMHRNARAALEEGRT